MERQTMNDLLKAADVMQKLGIGRTALWRWMKAGILPPPIRIGKRYMRWREEDIEAFISNRRPSA
jgi:prophage regulatory protein